MSTIRPVGNNGYEIWNDAEARVAYANFVKESQKGIAADMQPSFPLGINWPYTVTFRRETRHGQLRDDMCIAGKVVCDDSVNHQGIQLTPGTWKQVSYE